MIETNFGFHDDVSDENGDNSNRFDQEVEMVQSWSTYAKSCSIIAITTVVLLQLISQISKVGSHMWLNYGQNTTLTESYSFLTIFAIIGICSILLHIIQCVFLWVVCVICTAKYLHAQLINNIMR